MDVIDFPTQYGLQYPITKTPGPWIVVGICTFAAHDPDRIECGEIHSVDIHLDADDPNFDFADHADWPEIGAKTIEAYNFPFRRDGRLALRRGTDANVMINIWRGHNHSAAWMEAHRQWRAGIRKAYANVGEFHVVIVPG